MLRSANINQGVFALWRLIHTNTTGTKLTFYEIKLDKVICKQDASGVRIKGRVFDVLTTAGNIHVWSQVKIELTRTPFCCSLKRFLNSTRWSLQSIYGTLKICQTHSRDSKQLPLANKTQWCNRHTRIPDQHAWTTEHSFRTKYQDKSDNRHF